MDRSIGCLSITEILLKTALNTTQLIILANVFNLHLVAFTDCIEPDQTPHNLLCYDFQCQQLEIFFFTQMTLKIYASLFFDKVVSDIQKSTLVLAKVCANSVTLYQTTDF